MAAQRLAMLANPARDDRAEEFLAALQNLDDDIEIERIEPKRPEDIISDVRAAVDDGVEVVAAVGGDGTQRSVATAIAGTGARLGVVPGGTVNLLAKVLDVASMDAAVAAIVGGGSRSMDLGSCNDDTFVLNASSGYDAETIARADDGNKERWGKASFVRAAISAWRSTRSTHVTVTVDGTEVHSGPASSVIVTNVAIRSSADFQVAPDAEIDDGRLDLLVIRATSVWSSLRLVMTLARGRDPRPDDLLRSQGAAIDVAWSGDVECQLDGDAVGTDATFNHRCEPGALRVCN